MLVPNKFQFKKGQFPKDQLVMTLERYAEIMQAYQYEVNPKCKTLWIPCSSRRSVTLNLNHEVNGFIKDDRLFGENGNCGTAYVIIMVPNYWDDSHVQILAEKVAEKLGKNYEGHPSNFLRVLRADKIEAIEEVISENLSVLG
jgi:hypothetical protein